MPIALALQNLELLAAEEGKIFVSFPPAAKLSGLPIIQHTSQALELAPEQVPEQARASSGAGSGASSRAGPELVLEEVPEGAGSGEVPEEVPEQVWSRCRRKVPIKAFGEGF